MYPYVNKIHKHSTEVLTLVQINNAKLTFPNQLHLKLGPSKLPVSILNDYNQNILNTPKKYPYDPFFKHLACAVFKIYMFSMDSSVKKNHKQLMTVLEIKMQLKNTCNYKL